MKKFENPEIEVVNFSIEDVVTTSGDLPGDDNGLGWEP